ncbi:MAG: iron-sulfur cluster assembly accessory protein [Nitrospirae bacterium]|nr:iron-sulfur cluster assembly accessory protein [Nitrospirota bacterium]
MGVTVTEKAGVFLRRMIRFNGGTEKSGIRLIVKPGGCSGLSYDMELADEARPGEQVFAGPGFALHIPGDCLSYVEGSVIDFEDNMMNTQLVFRNPNAVSSCGCGTSFNVEGGPAAPEGGCSKKGSGP